MLCKSCGKNNLSNSRYCIKCGKELADAASSEDFCPVCKKPLLYPDKPCPYCTDYKPDKEESVCNSCKSSLRKGFLFGNAQKLDYLERIVLELDPSKVFCKKCLKEQKIKAAEKIDTLKLRFNKFIEEIPVITLQKPINFTVIKYCGVVTSKAAVSLKDISNIKANTSEFNVKFNLGEKFCVNSIKKNAIKQGANAIIGCDIEYSELSQPDQTFMVAMMGTAVVLEEFEILSEYEQTVFNQLEKL